MTAPRAIKQCCSCGEKKQREEFPFPRSQKCSDCHVSRVCIRCNERKPVEEFPLSPGKKHKDKEHRLKRCHPCHLADRRKKYDEYDRFKRFKWQYGITHERWEALFEAQGRRCANPGCRAEEPGGNGWCTDHDHSCCPQKSRSCGQCIRGILCFGCNVMLGCARDNEEVLAGALEYLRVNASTLASAPAA